MEYEISVSCRDLADTDFFSKSDPQLILLRHVPHTKRFDEVGRTEMIKNCLSPEFEKKFRVTENPQFDNCMRVAVIDIDNFDNTELLAEQEFIGRAEFPLSDLTSQGSMTIGLGNSAGFVTMKAVPYNPELDGQVTLELVNVNLEFGDRAGFLEIHRADRPMSQEEAVSSNDFTLVLRSQLLSDASRFQTITASLFTLSMGNRELPLRLSCWRRKSNGSHKQLASGVVSLAEIEAAYIEESTPTVRLVGKSGDECRIKIEFIDIRAA